MIEPFCDVSECKNPPAWSVHFKFFAEPTPLDNRRSTWEIDANMVICNQCRKRLSRMHDWFTPEQLNEFKRKIREEGKLPNPTSGEVEFKPL